VLHQLKTPLSRRQLLGRSAAGFGGLALNGMFAEQALAERPTGGNPLAARDGHHRATAKRVIFLFMSGGPSHVDLFDHKPMLDRDHGKPLPFEERGVQFAKRGNLMKSPWRFRQTGDSGIPMSELWQHLPEVADDLCMIHSVCETNVAHGGACMKLHTGNEAIVRPSMGAWVSYGLGTENNNLPSFITICPQSIHGGVDNYGTTFLPSIHQGVALGTPGYPNAAAKDATFAYMKNSRLTHQQQRLQLDLLRQMHDNQNSATAGALDARIQSFELAFRMQTAAPEVMDVSAESQATRQLYGLDSATTENFGLQCLLARRYAESGVRFIQINHAGTLPDSNEQWDQHSHLVKGHSTNVAQIDKPITGLIKDLKSRGLLEDTLLVWGGEFGRTPTVEARKGPFGRDHHPDGFTMWMAGGGVRSGFRYGRTDDYGYHAVEDRCTIHDLHATILHLMGLDHERLTHRHEGRDYRLTDVAGNVAEGLLQCPASARPPA
jgi:hypothetical protein